MRQPSRSGSTNDLVAATFDRLASRHRHPQAGTDDTDVPPTGTTSPLGRTVWLIRPPARKLARPLQTEPDMWVIPGSRAARGAEAKADRDHHQVR